MVRNTLSVFALTLMLAASSQAALIATATRVGGVTGGVAFTASENSGATAVTNLNLLTSGADSLWVSYALGVTKAATETVSSFNIVLTSTGSAGGFHQRWGFDDVNGTYTNATPSSTTAGTSGDSHLVLPSTAVVGVAPQENRIAKGTDADTTTPGFITANLGISQDVRNWGIGTSMTGAWGFNAADQAAQTSFVPFAYIVIPRGADPRTILGTGILAQAATTLQGGGAGPGYQFTAADFFPSAVVPEPATMSLFGLALVGFGFIRRRS